MEKWLRPRKWDEISSRKKQVIIASVNGLSNKEMAALLGIEEETIKTHVKELMIFLGRPKAAWWQCLPIEIIYEQIENNPYDNTELNQKMKARKRLVKVI